MSHGSRALLLLALALPPLAAQSERENTSPVGQLWVATVNEATLTNYISLGYRITDLEIYDPAIPRFSATLVQNTGAYQASGWWWYYGLTSTQVRNYLTQNNARPIDIESYVDGSGNRRFAVVMVSNTGAAAKPWYLFLGSSWTTIRDYVGANGYRIVDIDGYASGTTRVYAAITIQNSGADARSWWWYLGATPAQVGSLLSQNNARLVDLDPVGDGTYDIVMNRTGGTWWYWYGRSPSQVTNLVAQFGSRVVDIERNTNNTFDVILNNNSDALTTRIAGIINNGTTGFLGAYLRRLDGSNSTELVGLNENRTFEPASTLKTLPHVYTMYRASRGLVQLNTSWLVGIGTNGSCPTGGTPYVTETLETSLQLMMENSDNARTKRIVDVFGAAQINSHAASLGMTRTSINHDFGCGGPPANATTLADLGTLHDAVADGHLGSQRELCYELMIDQRTYPSVGSLNIDAVITTEAAVVGLTGLLLNTFRANVKHASKGGNYDWPRTPRFHGSYFGYVSLPYVVAGRVVPREYAVGAFFNDATVKDPAFAAIGTAYCEMLREEIRAAARTWVGGVLGSLSLFGTACSGSSGVPVTTATGDPMLGGRVTYTTSNLPPLTPAVLYLGASRTLWNGIPLPLDLGFLGAPSCKMATDPSVPVNTPSNSSGVATRILLMPSDTGMLGQEFHAQFWVLDPAANALGLITSRGITTRLGFYIP